jgi:hypothetical protein
MMPMIQIISLLCKIGTVKNRVVNKRERGKERMRKWIKRVGDRV